MRRFERQVHFRHFLFYAPWNCKENFGWTDIWHFDFQMCTCRLVWEQCKQRGLIPMAFSLTGHGNEVAKNDLFSLLLVFFRRSRSFKTTIAWPAIAYLIIACLFSDLTRTCFIYWKTGSWEKGPLHYIHYIHLKRAIQLHHPAIDYEFSHPFPLPFAASRSLLKCSHFCSVSIKADWPN